MTGIECVTEYKPIGMWMIRNNVSFYVEGSWIIFYRWAVKQGFGEKFLSECDFLWLPKYHEAVRRKEEEETRKNERHDSWMEQLRLKQNDKKRKRRMKEKENGITHHDNAVSPMEMGNLTM